MPLQILPVDQGQLNRLLTSMVVPNFPTLNASVAYLGKGSISIAFEGNASTYIPTMTGGVPSPEPYQQVMISVNLLKSQNLATQWRAQMELNTLLGPVSIYLDSAQFPKFNFLNCSIMGNPSLTGSGTDADYIQRVVGYYPINAALYG